MGKNTKKTKKSSSGGEEDAAAQSEQPGRHQRTSTNENLNDKESGGTDDNSESRAQCDAPQHAGAPLVSLHTDLPVSVLQLYSMLFTDCPLYQQLLYGRHVSNLNQEEWKPTDVEGIKEARKLTYVLQMNTVVAKEINVSETQALRACSRAGELYSLDIDTQNSGAPYTDCFTVQVHYCLRRLSATSCRFTLLGQLQFHKSVWSMMKTMIEKQTASGFHDTFNLIKRLATSASTEAEFAKTRAGATPIYLSDSTPVVVPAPHSRIARRKKLMKHGAGGERRTGVVEKRSAGSWAGGVSSVGLLALLVLLLNLNLLLYWDLARSQQTCDCPHDHFYRLLKAVEDLPNHRVRSLPPREELEVTLADILQSDRVLNKLKDSFDREGVEENEGGEVRGEAARRSAGR